MSCNLIGQNPQQPWLGRHSQGVPQLLVTRLPVPVSEPEPAQLASAQPPDWLSACEVLPGS